MDWNLKNIRHLDWLIALITWVVSIMAFNPPWMLIPYVLIGVLLIIWWLQNISKDKLEKFKSAKPTLLSRHNTSIDYERETLCIPILLLTKDDDFDSCLKRDLESINKDIKQYNSLAWAFVNDFNSKIMSLGKLRLIEHDDTRSSSKPLKYHTKHLYYEIGQQLSSFDECHYGKRSPLNFNTRPITESDGITRWKADIGCNILFASVDKTEIDEIEKEILEIFDTAVHSTRFKELNRFFERIKNRYEIYKNEMVRVLLENGVSQDELLPKLGGTYPFSCYYGT